MICIGDLLSSVERMTWGIFESDLCGQVSLIKTYLLVHMLPIPSFCRMELYWSNAEYWWLDDLHNPNQNKTLKLCGKDLKNKRSIGIHTQ